MVQICKPTWLCHGQNKKGQKFNIFSIHVHPSGKKFATGCVDQTIKVWNVEPCLSAEAERNPSIPKLLSTIDRPEGTVMCVRWSNMDGKYLAAGSDDKRILIFALDTFGLRGNMGGHTNVENYSLVKTLHGHGSDVSDLAWSPDNSYLASCAFDGKIIIWDGATFEMVASIEAHDGFVKGLTWDPVGKYLASQSDDKTLKIWRSSDWKLEATVSAPFELAPSVTMFRRPSWSPEGSALVAANATNGFMNVAVLVDRSEWSDKLTYVGHTAPIECTAFNPHLFEQRVPGATSDATETLTLLALGSQDHSISIFTSSSSHPLLVTGDYFDHAILDLCWSPDGLVLFATSYDGTVGIIQFEEEEIGRKLAVEEIESRLSKYGYKRHGAPQPIEVPSQITLESQGKTFRAPDKAPGATSAMDRMMGSADISRFNGSSSAPVSVPAPTQLPPSTPAMQKVTITKDGKKRIQPVFLQTLDGSPVPSLAPTQPMTITTTAMPTSAPLNVFTAPSPNAPQSSGVTAPSPMSTAVARQQASASKLTTIMGSPHVLPSVLAMTYPPVPLGYPKPKPLLTYFAKSSFAPNTAAGKLEIRNHLPTTKVEVTFATGDTKHWTDIIRGMSSAVIGYTNGRYHAAGLESGEIIVWSRSGRRLLPPIKVSKAPCFVDLLDNWFMVIDANAYCHVWNLETKQFIMTVSLYPILQPAPPRPSGPPAPSAVGADGLESVESSTQSQLRSRQQSQQVSAQSVQPAPVQQQQQLERKRVESVSIRPDGSPLITLSNGDVYLFSRKLGSWCLITTCAWDEYVNENSCFEPVTSGVANVKNSIGVLGRILESTKQRILDQQRERASLHPIPTLVQQPQPSQAKNSIAGSGIAELGWLESQLNSAILLDSLVDYEHCLKLYARKLADEGAWVVDRVKELCEDLCGVPVDENAVNVDIESLLNSSASKKSQSGWEPMLLGRPKRDLLNMILPILSQNRLFQRLTNNYLEILSRKHGREESSMQRGKVGSPDKRMRMDADTVMTM